MVEKVDSLIVKTFFLNINLSFLFSYFFNITSFSKCGHVQAWVNACFILPVIIIAQLCKYFRKYFLNLTCFMGFLPTPPVTAVCFSMDQVFCSHFKMSMSITKLIIFSLVQAFLQIFTHLLPQTSRFIE